MKCDIVLFNACAGDENMKTKEQLAILISKRAREQFSRDVYRLGLIMAQNYGELTVDDMKAILSKDLGEKTGFFSRFFKAHKDKVMNEIDDDKYYLMQLAFMLMDIKSVQRLTLSDLDPKGLGEIYFKFFKREYEECERRQYQLCDVDLEERVMNSIYESKGKTIPMENEII